MGQQTGERRCYELVGYWKWGARDANLSDGEMALKSSRKPYCYVKHCSHHISLAISVKINWRRVLSMTPDTLLIETFLTTCNSAVQASGAFGDILRFKPGKRYLLEGKRGPNICVHYP